VDLYIHSPIRLHSVVLNQLSIGTTLSFYRSKFINADKIKLSRHISNLFRLTFTWSKCQWVQPSSQNLYFTKPQKSLTLHGFSAIQRWIFAAFVHERDTPSCFWTMRDAVQLSCSLSLYRCLLCNILTVSLNLIQAIPLFWSLIHWHTLDAIETQIFYSKFFRGIECGGLIGFRTPRNRTQWWALLNTVSCYLGCRWSWEFYSRKWRRLTTETSRTLPGFCSYAGAQSSSFFFSHKLGES
jgi:hypothetical protein